MSAAFVDMSSIRAGREPRKIEVLDLMINPSNGELLTGKKAYALWCSSRDVAMLDFTIHHEDGSSRRADAPAEWFERHPVEADDFPGGTTKHGPGPSSGTPARLAQIICDGRHINTAYVEDPVLWVREHVEPSALSFR